MEAIDMTHSAFCERPFEKHTFRSDSNNYNCDACGRPRAMHLKDGFIPTYKDSDVMEFKPFGRVRPRNRAMGFRGESRKKRIYNNEGNVIWTA